MKKYFNNISDFLPSDFREVEEPVRVKVTAYVVVFLFIFLSASIIHTCSVITGIASNFPFPILLLSLFIQLGIFYRFKNIKLSANIILTTISILLGWAAYQHGGMYSDNLLFMVLVPMLASLMSGYKSGLTWLALLLVFHGVLFYMDSKNPIYFEQANFERIYYHIAIMLLFILISSFTFLNIIIQNRFSNKLQIQKTELERQKQELKKKSATLESYQEEILKSNEALERFAYAVSHDLKQPLRSITSFSNLLERDLAKNNQLNDTTKEFLSFIQDGGKNMNSLITDLMEFSKIKSTTQDELKSVKTKDIIDRVLINLRKLITENEAQIILGKFPENIYGIEVKLLQLFQNLISNAIKFKNEDRRCTIYINSTNFDHHTRFEIKDNGIGIDDKYQKEIFNLFFKLHGSNEVEGTGIGLSTCKAIVDQHGGKIWVESQYGQGSTFYFTILNKNLPQPISQAPENLILKKVKSN